MSQRRSFFALRDDLLPVLQEVESKVEVVYVDPDAGRGRLDLKAFDRASDLRDLCSASRPNAIACARWWLVPRGAPIGHRRVPGPDGVLHVVDQISNVDAVLLMPGGLWNDDVVLSGELSTLYRAPFADRVMNTFRNATKRRFTHVGAYWVGPLALDLFRRGARLTAGVQCPREYDLALK